MVVLHGFAEHPTAALQLGAMIDTEYRYRICAPHGPIKVAASKYAFYRSVSRMNPDPEDFNGARFAIHDAVEAAQATEGVDAADTVLVGFSQGAGLASLAALSKVKSTNVRALIVFGCRVYSDELVEWDFDTTQNIRIFAAHGIKDSLSPMADVKEFFNQVGAKGADVTWETHPHGHSLSAENISTASRWLLKLP
jgi:predicted esterase